MRILALTFSLVALLVLSPNAVAQGSASGDTYKDPFSGGGSQTPRTAPASNAKKPTSKHGSSGSGLVLVLVLVAVALLATGVLMLIHRRRSRDGPTG
ncbi:MAG: hypothetical protein ACR2K9_00565 [Solirubrobacteraceae bacterium]